MAKRQLISTTKAAFLLSVSPNTVRAFIARYCQYLWMSAPALGRLCAADALGVLMPAARSVR
jgi:hypothetical protein